MIAVRPLRTLALCCALLALAAFSIADVKPLIMLMALVVGFSSRLLVAGETPRTLPRLLLNLLVGAAAVYLLLALLSSQPDTVISSLTDFLAMVLMVKMLDRATMRDEAQMLTLSVFVVIGAVLTGAQLALGIVLVLYTPLIIVTVVVWQIVFGQERALQRARGLGVSPLSTRAPRLRRQLGATILAAVVLSLVTGAAAFVITPRQLLQNLASQWGRPLPGATTGFRDNIRLGEGGLISQSTTPVGEVTLRGPGGEARGRREGPLYLRGATLEVYNPDTQQWTSRFADERGRGRRLEPGDPFLLASEGAGRLSIVMDVALRNVPSGRAPMFSLLFPASVTLQGGQAASIEFNPETGLLTRHAQREPGGRLEYRVESLLDYVAPEGDHIADSPPGDGLRTGAAAFSVGPVRELAERLLREADVPVEGERDAGQIRRAAQAMVNYFRTQFAYTLEMVVPKEGQDPILMFLFDTKRGHCEYFAAGMVALLQSVGIPARIATGYATSEFNDVGGHYVIRESDAHAWVEVALRPGRWETFDPTPPGELQSNQRETSGLLAWLRQLYDALEFSWAQNIVSFDSAKRSQIMGDFNPPVGDPGTLRGITRFFRSLNERIRSALPDGLIGNILSVVLVIMGSTVMALGGYLLARALARRWRARREPSAPDYTRPSRDLAARLAYYPRMLHTLRSAGLPKPAGTPPLAHARTLESSDPEVAALVADLSRRYYALRFGAREPSPAPAALDERAALAELRTRLARRTQG